MGRRASSSAPEGQLLQFYRHGAGYGSTEPSVAAMYKRRGAVGGVEQQRSELGLLWGLGWPLLIGKVSDEISWLMIYHYWYAPLLTFVQTPRQPTSPCCRPGAASAPPSPAPGTTAMQG